MAIANFDEIIRRILGLQKPPPDDAGLSMALKPDPSIEEGEMVPLDKQKDWVLQRMEDEVENLPYSTRDPYFVGPMIIPNITEDDAAETSKSTPLRRGNPKTGSGLDI